jgi:predicted anti-sigma-YlaC factor YlaD
LGTLEGDEPMVSCKTIIAHLSEYLDGDATPEMLQKIEKHLRGYHRCTAVYDSTRKMLVITGDERAFEIPAGFSERLHTFLDGVISRGSSI